MFVDWVFSNFQSLKPNPDEHRIQPIEASQLAHLFSRVAFGEERQLEEVRFTQPSVQQKRALIGKDGWRRLVVLPHLTGGSHGVNADASLQWAGELVAACAA